MHLLCVCSRHGLCMTFECRLTAWIHVQRLACDGCDITERPLTWSAGLKRSLEKIPYMCLWWGLRVTVSMTPIDPVFLLCLPSVSHQRWVRFVWLDTRYMLWHRFHMSVHLTQTGLPCTASHTCFTQGLGEYFLRHLRENIRSTPVCFGFSAGDTVITHCTVQWFLTRVCAALGAAVNNGTTSVADPCGCKDSGGLATPVLQAPRSILMSSPENMAICERNKHNVSLALCVHKCAHIHTVRQRTFTHRLPSPSSAFLISCVSDSPCVVGPQQQKQ